VLTREDWQGVDLVGDRFDNSLNDFKNFEFALRTAAASRARVIVFPEAAIRCWTPTAAMFFEQSINRLAAQSKTMLIGAIIPSAGTELAPSNFSKQLDILQGRNQIVNPLRSLSGSKSFGSKYRNTIIAMGADSATLDERIPVPIGMWHPFSESGAPMNIDGTSILFVAEERVAVLICYEQLLVWPALVSTLNEPTVLVGIANEQWVDGTPVPRLQRTYLRAWARLIGVTLVSASSY
jgi:predicted amidohydrolase